MRCHPHGPPVSISFTNQTRVWSAVEAAEAVHRTCLPLDLCALACFAFFFPTPVYRLP